MYESIKISTIKRKNHPERNLFNNQHLQPELDSVLGLSLCPIPCPKSSLCFCDSYTSEIKLIFTLDKFLKGQLNLRKIPNRCLLIKAVEPSSFTLCDLSRYGSFWSKIRLVAYDSDLDSFVGSLPYNIDPVFYAWEGVGVG